jgi:hypothetical protein
VTGRSSYKSPPSRAAGLAESGASHSHAEKSHSINKKQDLNRNHFCGNQYFFPCGTNKKDTTSCKSTEREMLTGIQYHPLNRVKIYLLPDSIASPQANVFGLLAWSPLIFSFGDKTPQHPIPLLFLSAHWLACVVLRCLSLALGETHTEHTTSKNENHLSLAHKLKTQ